MKQVWSDDDLSMLFDGSIEDLLLDLSSELEDPRYVMYLSAIVAGVNARREVEGRPLVAMPASLHRLVNQYAERGMPHRRGRQRNSYLKELFIASLAEMARDRKEDLIRTPGAVRNKLEATLQAAEETAALGAQARVEALDRRDAERHVV
jgi:hypothetical protein